MTPRVHLTVFAVTLAALTAFAPAQDAGLRRGMTPAEVEARLGKPRRVVRQILYRRHIEQWVYDSPTARRVEFNCVRGRDPYLLHVVAANPGRP